jgi:hypothetical protein
MITTATTTTMAIRLPSPEQFSHTTHRFLASACPWRRGRSANLHGFIVTARHRESPYEIVSLERAISSISQQIHPLPCTLEKVTHCSLNQPTCG